ncbi:MAG: hypothetical protein II812_08215 [Prevotella sp.]|nr:hypothetical protein [Prevotella sp.]
MRRLLPLLLCLCSVGGVSAQEHSLFDSLQYRAELQGTLAGGDHSPLWLNANKYGLSSLKKANGYIRGAIQRPLSNDDGRRWGVGYGVDLALAAGFTSTLVIQQAYIEARWLKGVLTVGAKEMPMELKNQELSSGSQTLGINARPVPQVRIALPDYWSIPGTCNWLALKGHIAYGKTTDDGWQKDFKAPNTRYTENTLFHSKAGYLRIGPKNITFELGLEMASQFGGKSYTYENGVETVYENSSSLKAFWNALIPGGSDATDGNFKNVEGNQLGSWVMRLNFDQPTWNIGVYADQFFEDHSMMTHFSKSGDGYFRYDFKDWLLGVELKLKQTRWLEGVVVEYLYSKYQGGPVYHDHTANVDIQISGRDNYYNHHLFTGWQHWGQVMGNPLYRSPLYNDDRKIEVEHNRFKAWHLGFNGSPIDGLHYRVLATWQRSFGSYYYLPPTPVENVSLLAEASYALRHGWLVKGAFAMDNGKLRGESYGVQLSVIKTGIIGKKK